MHGLQSPCLGFGQVQNVFSAYVELCEATYVADCWELESDKMGVHRRSAISSCSRGMLHRINALTKANYTYNSNFAGGQALSRARTALRRSQGLEMLMSSIEHDERRGQPILFAV